MGTATDVQELTVVDNFGDLIEVGSTARRDDATMSSRPWRMFEIDNDVLHATHPSPWLIVAPTVVGDLTGAALERVAFVHDEGANLVWGIEKLVEGPSGRSLDRATLGTVGTPTSTAESPTPATPPGDDGQSWAYHLESDVPPPYWIPFLAERVTRGGADIRLRRARMQQWETSAATNAGPHGMVLDPSRPRWLQEEEVPRSGIRVDRRWRYARGSDGVGHLWLQLEKVPGRGERASGVRWDVIEITPTGP